MYSLNILFSYEMIDFIKIFQLKGLKPKNKGHSNFYKCCDLMKKVYLMIYITSSNDIKGGKIFLRQKVHTYASKLFIYRY